MRRRQEGITGGSSSFSVAEEELPTIVIQNAPPQSLTAANTTPGGHDSPDQRSRRVTYADSKTEEPPSSDPVSAEAPSVPRLPHVDWHAAISSNFTKAPSGVTHDQTVIRDIPVAPGIPLAKVNNVIPWTGMILWMSSVLLGAVLLLRFVDRYTVDQVVVLPTDRPVSVDVSLKNCVAKFSRSPTPGRSDVVLHSWALLMENVEKSTSLDLDSIAGFTHAAASTTPKPPPVETTEPETIMDELTHREKLIGLFWRCVDGFKRLMKVLLPPAAPSRDHYHPHRPIRQLLTWDSVVDYQNQSQKAWDQYWHKRLVQPFDRGSFTLINPWEWKTDNELRIDIQVARYRPYFQCLVEFRLDENFTFENVAVKFAPADAYVDVIADVPVRANHSIEISALHAKMKLGSLEAKKIRITLRDGSLFFALDGNREMYDYVRPDALIVSSRTAPVFIEGSIPVDITMAYDVATRAFVRGYDISVTNDDAAKSVKLVTWTDEYAALSVGFYSLSITVLGSDAPLYLMARGLNRDPAQDELMTWAGVEQQDKPHLLSYSASLVENIPRWISFQPSSPWVALVSLLGEYLPEGAWRIVSSDAYLSGNNWFVLFSAGLLQPRTTRLQVHVMGLFCRGNRNKFIRENMADFTSIYDTDYETDDADDFDGKKVSEFYKKKWPTKYPGTLIGKTFHVSTCADNLIEQSFVVIWKTLKSSQSPSTVIVWTSEDGFETRYQLTSDTVVKVAVTITDTWLFSIAIVINLCVSLITAFILTKHYVPWIDKLFREELNSIATLCTASHRLNHNVTEVPPPEWNVNVVRLHFPYDGFVMRWNYSVPPETSRIAVHIVPAHRSTDFEVEHPRLMSHATVKSDVELASETTKLLQRQNDSVEPRHLESVVGNLVIYLPLSAVRISRLLGVKQRELFLPLVHPGKAPIDALQPYRLASAQQYRLRIVGLNENGRETAASGWTPDIQPGGQQSFADFPLIVLRKLFPSSGGSLALFVHKHCNVGPIFNVHIIGTDYVVEIFDERTIVEQKEKETSTPTTPNETTPLLGTSQRSKLTQTVDLELRIFFGKPGEERKRRHQALKYNRRIWNSVHLRGKPVFLRQEDAYDVYGLRAADQAYLFSIDRLSFGDVHFEVADLTSGHTIATASCGSLVFFHQCVVQNRPGNPHSEHGLCWKPFWFHQLYRGRSSAVPWGRLGVRLHAVTARSFARHDMTPRALLPASSGIVRFINDAPAATYPQGSDIVISWEWETPSIPKPEHIFLHIHDHETNQYISTLQSGRPVPNTGSFCWAVDVPFPDVWSKAGASLEEQRARTCYFTISADPYEPATTLKVLAQSNAFFVLKVLSLSHFELAYAAFCRTHNLEMEHVSEASLEALGVDVFTMPLKVCPDLREPLSFESYKTTMVHCPGQCIVSTTSKVLALRDTLREVVSHVNQRADAAEGIHVYKSVSLKIPFLENCAFDPDPCWWQSSSDIFFIKSGLLDSRVFLAIDKALGFTRHNSLVRPFKWLIKEIKRRWLTVKSYDSTHMKDDQKALLNALPYLIKPDPFISISRTLIYQIFPTLLHLILSLYQIWYFCSWPLTCMIFYCLYNYLEQDVQQSHHIETSPAFFSDIVFDPNLSFILSVPFPGPWLILGTCLWNTFMTVAIFIDPVTRTKTNFVARAIEAIASWLQIVHIYTVYVLVTTFMLWFFLGALINSDSFLPYAVMTGCVTFVTYTLWCNHVQAKEVVLSYIQKNQQTLLSVSFDKWFEYHHVDFDYRGYFYEISHAATTSTSIQAKQQMRDELRALKQMKIRELHLLQIQASDTALNKRNEFAPLFGAGMKRVQSSLESADSLPWQTEEKSARSGHSSYKRGNILQLKTTKLKEQLCYWVYDKVQIAHAEGLYFSFDENRNPQGLENLKGLPKGSRFATLEEANDESNRVEELLIGFDVAMLHDGVQYGPRFGYKVDRYPNPSQKYSMAVVASPRFPNADELEDQIKVALIFDNFDADGDGTLSFSEFMSWVDVCEKLPRLVPKSSSETPRKMDILKGFHQLLYSQGIKKIHSNASISNSTTNISETLAETVSVGDLEKYYCHSAEELDKDYMLLFPTARSDDEGSLIRGRFEYDKSRVETEDEDANVRPIMWMDDTTNGSWSESEDDTEQEERSHQSDHERDITDHFDDKSQLEDDHQDDDKIEDQKTPSKVLEQVLEDRVKEQLRTNINGLKLQYIFKHLTKECRGLQVEAITKSIPFIAQNVLDCHISLLAPSFGKDFLMPRRQQSARHRLAAAEKNNLTNDQLTLDIKLMHLDLIKNFNQSYSRVYRDMFESSTAMKGIADFYDHLIASKIQLKAARLTNIRVEINSAELDPSNRWAVTSTRPVCAFQAMRKFATFRSRRIVKVREILTLASSAGQHQGEVQVSLLTYALVESGMLRPAEIAKKNVFLKLDSGDMKEMELMAPRSIQCSRFLQKIIHQMHVGDSMTVNDLTTIIKNLMSEYLWFTEFRLLVNLLGIDLREDELPGRVWIDEIELQDKSALEEFQLLVRDMLIITNAVPNPKHFNPQKQQDQMMRERRNLFKTKKIFDQLSNGTLFLPVDLADEGVLLLTDNRMGFSAVIAALKHLGIGSLNMASSRNLSDTLTGLGVDPQSPVAVVEAQAGGTHQAETTGPSMSDAEFLTLFGVVSGGADAAELKKENHDSEKWAMDLTASDEFDWTRLGRNSGWPDSLIQTFKELTAASPGFMGKSQLSELVQKIKDFFEERDTHLEDISESQSSNVIMGDIQGLISFEMFCLATTSQGYAVSRHHARILWCLVCSELSSLLPHLHDESIPSSRTDYRKSIGTPDKAGFNSPYSKKSSIKSQRLSLTKRLSLTRKESGRLDDDLLLEILPVNLVAHSLARITLQPVDADGNVISLIRLCGGNPVVEDSISPDSILTDVPFSLIKGYEGYFTSRMFRNFIERIGVDVPVQGVRNIWKDLAKDPFEITPFLSGNFFKKKSRELIRETSTDEKSTPRMDRKSTVGSLTEASNDPHLTQVGSLENRKSVGSKYLRVGMDATGLDPTVGHHVQISKMRRQLPRLLMTGLWPSATKLLLQLYLQVNDFDEDRFNRSLERLSRDKSVINKYGMVRPEALPTVLTALSFEGMSFQMLKELVSHMKLSLPDRDIKRMFDMMDINHDHSLDLIELLSGFEILLSKLLPSSLLTEVGLSTKGLLGQILLTAGSLLIFFLFTALSFTSFVAVSTGASTAVQSLLALLGAVGLQSGATQDAEQVEEKMRQRLEAVIGGDTTTGYPAGKFLEEKMKENKEIMESIGRRIHFEATQKAKHNEMRPVALRFIIPKRFHPDAQDPRPCLLLRPGDKIRLEPVVLLSCGAKVLCPATASGGASKDISVDEALSWLRKGTGRVRSCDVMLQWFISPPLPHGLGLHMDPRTGVISGCINGGVPQLGSENYSPTDTPTSSPNPDTPIAPVVGVKMRRQTFLVTARNPGGAVSSRITFQVVPNYESRMN